MSDDRPDDTFNKVTEKNDPENTISKTKADKVLTRADKIKTSQQVKPIPMKTDFFKISSNKGLILKLWASRSRSDRQQKPLMSTIEIEEVSFNADGSRSYGARIRLPATYNTFMMATYLLDYLMEAREMEKSLREEMNREGIEWKEMEPSESD